MSKEEVNELRELRETLQDFYNEFQDEKRENRRHREEVEPLMELIRGGIVARKLLLWITSIIIGVLGSYAAVKGVFLK